MDTPTFRIASLCAGVGGIDLGIGLVLPNARTICYVENEVTNCRVLAARMAEGHLHSAPIWTNLKSFDAASWSGALDCLVAGYPCQPFSIAGNRRAAEDPRHLWPYVAQSIRDAQPAWVLLENVEHHLRLGFREVALELRDLGYRTAAGVFSAEEVGAPHLRKRLFALAYSPSRGRRLGWEPSELLRLADRSDPAMADAVSRLLPVEERREKVRTGPRPAGTQLADTNRKRREFAWRQADAAPLEVSPELGGLVFPPRPDDAEGWREALEGDPRVEPAVRGGSDGTADRVDRLRSLGNLVLPLVAAVALRTLLARHAQLDLSI